MSVASSPITILYPLVRVAQKALLGLHDGNQLPTLWTVATPQSLLPLPDFVVKKFGPYSGLFQVQNPKLYCSA